MSLTTRRRRPLDRSIRHLRDTRLVVVATEGSTTEKQYFRIFERMSSRIQVIILPTEDGKSAPKHVLDRLRKYRRENDLRREDLLCLVIDEDRWPDAQMADVAAKALQQHIELAISCPCFEVWLYLHHQDPIPAMATMSSQQMKEELRSLLGGYDHTNLQVEQFEPLVGEAVRRAKALNSNPTARWPSRPGTRVYRIIERMQDIRGG